MLVLGIIEDIGIFLNKFIIGLVTSLFKLVDSAYRIFLQLSKTNIFGEEYYNDIVGNIYKILSIVMLFALAYGILLKIVDPDGSSKGIDGKKFISKFVLSIILIAVVPSLFSFAYGFQGAVLDSQILGGILTGEISNPSDENISDSNLTKYGGITMSVNSFLPFFSVVDPDYADDVDSFEANSKEKLDATAISPDGKSISISCPTCTYEQVVNFAKQTGSFAGFKVFARDMYDSKVDFDWFAALFVAIFLIYAIISFCFDMAIRICKLAFFQVIAPIAIICNIIPKMDDVFKKWTSNTTKTFISVFTRTFVMNFGVYLISICVKIFEDTKLKPELGSAFLNGLFKCFVIMGIVAFVRQAPKLLSDLFGFGDGDMKLGIKDKLKAGGAFVAGAAIGGGITGLTRNALNMAHNIGEANKEKDAAKRKAARNAAIRKGIGSMGAGLTSGFTKGAWYAKDAGSVKDMKGSATKAANKTVENRMKRDNYTAAHSRGQGWLDDQYQVLKGHLEDSGVKIAGWAGYKNLEQIKLENAAMDEITSSRDTFDSDVDSYIEKELAKAVGEDGKVKEFAGVTEARAKALLDAQEALNAARVKGTGVAEAQKAYMDLLRKARYGIQNDILCSTANWDAKGTDYKAKLGKLRVDAVKYKGAIANNADLDSLKNAGIVGADFSQDADVTISEAIYDKTGKFIEYESKDKDIIDNMNKNIKVSRSNNDVEIATRQQKKQDDSKK